MIVTRNFNQAYLELLRDLREGGTRSTTRKGVGITELFDKGFKLTNPMQCLAYCRELSFKYLTDEFKFYISGSNRLQDAMKCSKFWEKCSDDGETVNSNYGKLLFHDKNSKGTTQFEHALACLKNNPQSKKAVMSIYTDENAYISNDNPCTMFLRARIDEEMELHLTAYMRSSDIYFGLPYDVPWFIFVQLALIKYLFPTYPELRLGTYTHIASSLHKYDRNEKALTEAANKVMPIDYPSKYEEFYVDTVKANMSYLKSVLSSQIVKVIEPNNKPQKISEPSPEQLINPNPFMKAAWDASKTSLCLKKHVGAALTTKQYGDEIIVNAFCGGVTGPACAKCTRDNDADKYYGDECPSVHSEMKCITHAMKVAKIVDFRQCTIYVTHGPCDACLKFCDYVGIKHVIYDRPYKTDYSHWPRIKVEQVNDGIARAKS